MAFYEDWILVSGAKDGTVQMYDLSVEGAGDSSTFMNQKNFFTMVQKEKFMEEENSVVDMIMCSNGLVFVLDKFKSGRVYSVFHGQKMFKTSPGMHFSVESLIGGKPTVTEFQVEPKPVFTVNNSRLGLRRHSLCELPQDRVERSVGRHRF